MKNKNLLSKVFNKYILDVPRPVNYTVSFVTLTSLLIDTEKAGVFAKLYYNVAMSIIASYIFYIIVIKIKEVRDKENINNLVSSKVNSILLSHKTQIKELIKASNYNTQKEYGFREQELKMIFSKINISDKSPMAIINEGNIVSMNWVEYFRSYNLKTSEDISKIFIHIHILDTELVKILVRIDESAHVAIFKSLPSYIKTQSLEAFVSTYSDYSLAYEDLEAYFNKNLKEYL